MKNIKQNLLLFIIAPLGALFIWLITKTIRVKIINKEYGMDGDNLKKAIFAFWHNRLFLLTGYFAGSGVCAIISKSSDGELVARISKILGYNCVRGSSSKGGASALFSMIKNKNLDKGFVITVDGPKGPKYKVKDGVIFLAEKTGLPIIPVTYSVKHKIEINSWDNFIIPMPWTSGEIRFGEPIEIKKENNSKVNIDKCRNSIEVVLGLLTETSL